MGYDILLLIAGLATLVAGGEFLVRGAVAIARKMQVSTLVIGMTVVSFGTSAPELLVSVKAAMEGSPAIAVGNVVGSNIANIALVLAITVLIFPIIVDRNTKRLDWPVMMLATLGFWAMLYDGHLARWEGIILFVFVVGYTSYLIITSRRQSKRAAEKRKQENQEEEEENKTLPMWLTMVYLLGGLVGLYFGAEWLLQGAVGLAKSANMSEEIIAVTIVAFGTSVPELVASGMAAIRHQTDISIGNLIGSNLFNICVVLGITSSVHPIDVATAAPDIMTNHIFWMVGISAALFPLLLIGKKMGRWKGALLLLTYITYIVIIVGKIKGWF